MSESTTSAGPQATGRAVTVINVFTPKAGKLQELIRTQRDTLPGLRAQIRGLQGSRLYQSQDGKNAVLISVFATPEHLREFQQSALFQQQRERLAPLLERADPALYELVYEAGSSATTARE
jgi:heme-degrading monooxygenase HmoA